jgi:anti-sigma factor RsiW
MNTMIDACHQAEFLMQAYLDNALSPEVSDIVDRHLAGCTWCRDAYKFEVRFRSVVKEHCAGDEPCREELRARLRGCCQEQHDWA